MTQVHLSEKQWTAIIAVGWVLVFVNASFARPLAHYPQIPISVDLVLQNDVDRPETLGLLRAAFYSPF